MLSMLDSNEDYTDTVYENLTSWSKIHYLLYNNNNNDNKKTQLVGIDEPWHPFQLATQSDSSIVSLQMPHAHASTHTALHIPHV